MSRYIYHDAEQRCQRDPMFRALVESLFKFACEEGYTPGELRDAASLAALKAELYAREIAHLAKEIVSGHLRPEDRP